MSAVRSPLPSIVVGLMIVAIFVVDAFTMLDVAIAVLYVAVVLMSVTFWRRYAVILITLLCMGLTVIAYGLSHHFMLDEGALARCIVSLIAIAVTAFLALRGQAATNRLLQREEALHRSQAQLAHVTRVTTLGELAASIAHEVNQPLAAISANGEAALRWLNRTQPDLDEAKTAITNMVGDTQRASEVIKRIRALVRKSDPQYVALDINNVARESTAMVQRELRRHGVQLNVELAEDLPQVRGDRVQLQQVIINLLVNAMQAMSHDVSERRRLLTLRTARSGDGGVLVEVRDTGPGIDATHAEKLFDAFFTTKQDGMGMGLPICRSIIETHGGRIWMLHQPDPGATLQFSLPKAGA